MKIFLSSTFRELIEEREAVLEALHKKQISTLAMEYFVASPSTPLETALDQLRKSVRHGPGNRFQSWHLTSGRLWSYVALPPSTTNGSG